MHWYLKKNIHDFWNFIITRFSVSTLRLMISFCILTDFYGAVVLVESNVCTILHMSGHMDDVLFIYDDVSKVVTCYRCN